MSNQPNDKLPGSQRTNDQGQPVDAAGQVIEGPTEASNGAPVASGEAAPVVAPTEVVDEATLEEQRRQKIAEKSFKDEGRNAIAARARQRREEENQAFREGNAEQAALGDAVAGLPSADLIARMEAEARGEPDPIENRAPAAAPRAAAPAAAPAAATPAPLAPSRSSYRIRVYGEERDASEEEVVQAGIAALQKQHAAEKRLQDAATYEAQLEEYAGQLNAYADTLRTRGTKDSASTQPAGGSATPQPPASGAAGQEIRELRKKSRAALLRGDDETAAELDAQADELLIRAASAAVTAQPSRSSEQGALPEPPVRTKREPWSRDDRVKINETFARDYGDLLANDDTFTDAKALMDARLADPRYAGMTPEELAQDVGERIRRAQGVAPATAPAATPTQQTLESRRTLKAQIPITPPAGSARAPSSAAQAPRYPTRSEYVQGLRQRSGSNSSR